VVRHRGPAFLMGRVALTPGPTWLPARHVIPQAGPYDGPMVLTTLCAHDTPH